jgi:hypothetical protein
MLIKNVFITVYQKVECFFNISPSFILQVLNKLPYRVIEEERLIFWDVIVGDIVRKNMFIWARILNFKSKQRCFRNTRYVSIMCVRRNCGFCCGSAD